MKKFLLSSAIISVFVISCQYAYSKTTSAPSFPYPAIVGYWGVQAAQPSCRTTTEPLTATANGYNVIMVSFAAIAGDGSNAPINNCVNFFKDGSSISELKGAITFPSPTLGLKSDDVDYILTTLKNQIVELNNQGTIVLLSMGGAGALLPDERPDPQDVLDAFVSFNDYLNQGDTETKQLIHGIDWDLENSVDSKDDIEWMAQVSFVFKDNNFIVSCAPQSTNFNAGESIWASGSWNCYVPLIYAMETYGKPLDAIMVQWYEPGGSRPDQNTETSISSFIEKYYSDKFIVTPLPESSLYPETTWNVGEWFSKPENLRKLIPGIGAGKGWNGVTDYTPDVLCSVFNDMNGKFGGYMVWDIEIDSGSISQWANGNWPLANGFKIGLGHKKAISWKSTPTASNITKISATVSWEAQSTLTDTISYSYTVTDDNGKEIASGNGISVKLTGLTESTTYNVSITATQNKESITAKANFSTLGDGPVYPSWNIDKTYIAGDKVTYNVDNKNYEAKWWTQGTAPSNNPSGPWNPIK